MKNVIWGEEPTTVQAQSPTLGKGGYPCCQRIDVACRFFRLGIEQSLYSIQKNETQHPDLRLSALFKGGGPSPEEMVVGSFPH
ncbi:hypothetical protein, partial [Acidaminococcus timonensis]|uniref:hypothetical protein n=1 Tax=Acidaminococcus timonensis TaxID=1871002 RepID=UPI0025EDD97B